MVHNFVHKFIIIILKYITDPKFVDIFTSIDCVSPDTHYDSKSVLITFNWIADGANPACMINEIAISYTCYFQVGVLI